MGRRPVRCGYLLWQLLCLRLRARRHSVMGCRERAAMCRSVGDQVRMAVLDARCLDAIEAESEEAQMMYELAYPDADEDSDEM